MTHDINLLLAISCMHLPLPPLQVHSPLVTHDINLLLAISCMHLPLPPPSGVQPAGDA